jgi:hypothetical protein
VAAEDAGGRWAPFRLRPYDRICAQWLILHKVDNNDQMRWESSFRLNCGLTNSASHHGKLTSRQICKTTPPIRTAWLLNLTVELFGVCDPRYIHERLAQCPEQEALEGAAQKLAAAAGRPWPVVGPLEVRYTDNVKHKACSS